ncbi:hypothetical protein [Paraburkholderia xenovorans]
MKWTTDTPTEQGLYWLHEEDDDPNVVALSKNPVHGMLVLWHGSESETPLSILTNCRWYGPITPPSEE